MCSIIKLIILHIRILIDVIIDCVFGMYWNKYRKPIPSLSKQHAILAESATTLAAKIKAMELKSEDLVRAVVERIKEVNPIINAIAAERFKDAIAEAQLLDGQIAAGLSEEDAQKPFLGVPFTTKESQAVKGMPLTMGLVCRRKEVAAEDSEAVVRLKNAGAILVATTNLPELLIWQETRNNVYGRTNNPHHSGRSPGGSSGAEAALTASYATTISLCSDVGGSTRMPAFYCGMFGHHPTPGHTDLRGVFFHEGGDEESMFSLGFISKHVEDLAPLTRVVAGDKAEHLRLESQTDITSIKFYYMEYSTDMLVSPPTSSMRYAMKRVVSKISKDVKVTSVAAPQAYQHEGFNHMYKLWRYWMSKEPEDLALLFNNGKTKASGVVELLKWVTGLSKHCLYSVLRLLEHQWLPMVNSKWAEQLTKEMKEDLFSKLGDSGVLLLPSGPSSAPPHGSCLLGPFNFAYWAVVNVLKCPATQVPIGVDSKGLPIGIQVVAAPKNDALCLIVAKYLEKEFGGAVMACDIQQ